MTEKKTLSMKERAQLGGFAIARKTDMAELGRRGAEANMAKNGREQLIRANHIRWGKLPSPSATAPDGNSRPYQSSRAIAGREPLDGRAPAATAPGGESATLPGADTKKPAVAHGALGGRMSRKEIDRDESDHSTNCRG